MTNLASGFATVAAVIIGVVVVAVGVAAFLYGGFDDSPGLQLIGVVIVLTAVALMIRYVRRSRTARRS